MLHRTSLPEAYALGFKYRSATAMPLWKYYSDQIVFVSLRRQFGVGILHSCRKSRPPTMIALEKFDRAFAFRPCREHNDQTGQRTKCLAAYVQACMEVADGDGEHTAELQPRKRNFIRLARGVHLYVWNGCKPRKTFPITLLLTSLLDLP